MIEHEGIVERISDRHVVVRITSMSACALCHAKSMCSTLDSKDKMIDVFTKENVEQGQKVMVTCSQEQGFRAVGLAYLLPIILVIVVLAVTVLLTQNEKLAGTLSLAILIPYFVILRMMNNRLKKTFSYEIKPINE